MAIRGALAGSLTALKTGNPWLILAGAGAGAGLELLQPKRKSVKGMYDSALADVRESLLTTARQEGGRGASDLSANLAALGYGQDTRAVYAQGTKQAHIDRALQRYGDIEAQTQLAISGDEAARMEADRLDVAGDYASIAGQIGSTFQWLANPSPFDSEGMRKVREWANLNNVDPINLEQWFDNQLGSLNRIDVGGGISFTKDSWIGKSYTRNQPLIDGLIQGLGGYGRMLKLLGGE